MEVFLRFQTPLVFFFDVVLYLTLGPDISLCLCRSGLGLSRIQFPPGALHQIGHLRRDYGAHAYHILTHRLKFDEGADDVVLVPAKGIPARSAAIRRVPDENFIML